MLNNMKILITGKLADRSLLNHVYPLTLLDDVDEILIVRDTPSSVANKIKYYCPPRWSLKVLPLAFVFKFIIMILLSIHEKPTFIHGYLLFPHALMAFFVGKLTGRKIGISLLAGPVELYASGSPIGTYSYCNSLPILNMRAKMFSYVLTKSDFITVTGSYTKDFLISIGIDENKIFVLPHLIDNRFERKDIDKEYDLIYVGRLAKVKHVDILLKAVQLTKNEYPDINAVIVGDGECRSALENLSNNLGLSENIHFVGYQTNVWDWYNKAKISVLTSEREGFPYSVVESLSCGLPVISSDCGDVNDLLKTGYNGFVINRYTDYEAFAFNIGNIMRNKRVLKKYSDNSIKSVKHMNAKNISSTWEYIIELIDIT
jgi:glycosyltransferase involved in cell wall biosynthesis